SFEKNQGQTDGSVQFLARQAGYTLFLTPGEAVLSLHSSPPRPAKPGIPAAGKPPTTPLTDTVRMELIGANTRAQAAGVDPLPGKSNYFVGNDPAKWHTDVPTYAKVRYQSIYPGIDLLYYGNQEGRLEHDFVISPGADPNAIVLSMRDNQGTAAPENGGLTLHTKTGNLTLRSPVVYQEIKGERKTIPATYTLAGNQIRFKLGSYDRNAPLVIDPVIQYSGNFGGGGIDAGGRVAVDGSGNAYVSGVTYSTNFPLVKPFQSYPEKSTENAFVAKINSTGTALVYSTYLGGKTGNDITSSSGIAVDNTGRAYVTGTTNAVDFPVKNAYQSASAGGIDAFITVFSPTGNTLIYSTYLGGSGGGFGIGIALDSSQNAYITGASGVGFPTLHSVQPQGNVFVAKFNKAGTLQYSSVIGDSPISNGLPTNVAAIAVDTEGSAYITGSTNSQSFPIRNPAFQSKCLACPDENGFVTKFAPSGASLVYSTFLGGPQTNSGNAIAVDTSGNAYIGGFTGHEFPVTSNAFQKIFGGGGLDGFVAKLNPSGTGLIFATYLGGMFRDDVLGLALDEYRQVYVTGITSSPNFPLKASMQSFANRGQESFLTTLSNSGSSIVYYSTYLYVQNNEGPAGIAVDKALNVYLTGRTHGEVPTTPGAISIGDVKQGNVFISKLVIMDDLALGLSASPSPVAHGGTLTYTIAVTSKGPDFGYNVRMSDPIPAGTTFVSYNAGGGKCTAPAVGGAGTLNCEVLQLNKGDTWNVKLTVHVTAASGSTLSNTATTVSNTQDFTPANNTGTITTHVD
ncbi:MAG: SBBP repeat-containing protein, partial [Silvibacterium sp.]